MSRLTKYGDRAFRRATAAFRHYPQFLIIGGIRCGTTSLIRYLGEHPQVGIASAKEPHYFDWNYRRGDNWYRSFFPLSIGPTASAMMAGESSPGYLMDPEAPSRAAAAMPDAKLLLLVRNPVERAHSHFRYRQGRGHEPADTFEQALADEPRRMERAAAADRGQLQLRRYFHHGNYADGLSRWLEHFDRGQLLVLQSEDFYANTPEAFRRVVDFLGLTQYELDNYVVHNSAAAAAMNPDTRSALVERYREPNRRFYDLVGTDFGWE